MTPCRWARSSRRFKYHSTSETSGTARPTTRHYTPEDEASATSPWGCQVSPRLFYHSRKHIRPVFRFLYRHQPWNFTLVFSSLSQNSLYILTLPSPIFSFFLFKSWSRNVNISKSLPAICPTILIQWPFYLPWFRRMVTDRLTSEGPGLIPDRSMWHLRWTTWRWGMFFVKYFAFVLSLPFHQCSILMFSVPGTNVWF